MQVLLTRYLLEGTVDQLNGNIHEDLFDLNNEIALNNEFRDQQQLRNSN